MAAEEKKPKIDLKARLGKQGAGAPAPAPFAPGAPVAPPGAGKSISSLLPPAGAGGSVPPVAATPSFAPAGHGGASQVGVPMPPFAGASKPSTDPFGAQIAPTRSAAPQTFKIEIDDETIRAARKGGKRAGILATITALGGLGLGFAWGGRSADAKGANIALEGAQELIADIDKSQVKIKELADKIGAAVKDMKDKKFPETFSSDLGGLSIPFGAEKLAGRNIGRFDGKTLQLLISYTNSVEALNDRKDALKNLFSGQKKAIVDALGAAGNPKVSWSVFVQKSPAHGPLAILAPVNPTDAFAYKEANWPNKFKISNGREFVDTDRYATGDVISTEKKVVAIPLEPESVAAAFPNDILGRITSELAKTAGTLSGGTGPDDNDSGIIKKGEQLLTALKRIGQK